MSTESFYIQQYCIIENASIIKNGKELFGLPGTTFDAFIDAAYKHLQISYPKFYKMDRLAKLGFITSEVLLATGAIAKLQVDKTGIIIANKSSSLDTDARYVALMNQGIPSPAVFVYSLPNIVIGEICIRNGFTGENAFFVAAHYDIPAQVDYVQLLLQTDVVKSCICGWVELLGDEYSAFLCLVSGNQSETPFNGTQIETIFKK